MHRPYDYAPRTLDPHAKFTLAYVGCVSEAKGVGDLLRALRLIDKVALTIVGQPNSEMEHLASGLDVRFTGVIWNEDIPQEMRHADAIVIPSRHEYPEGLPGTMYQALAARTPIIASDHPMFRGAIVHEQSALIFPAGDESALAFSIQRLANDPGLYATLSANSLQAWEALQLPLKRGEFIEHWLSDQPGDREWLFRHRLQSGLYDQKIALRRPALGAATRRSAVGRAWSSGAANSKTGLALASGRSTG
jgi:glycosyltransferase involved in cell wall biosynthesis